MTGIEGKAAIVTGAARGQGEAHASLLAEEGAKVLLTDVLDEEGEAAAERISSAGGTATYAHLDVSSKGDWETAVEIACERLGPVTILVNNAGVATRSAILETSDEEWEKTIGINERGVFLGMRHCLPSMIGASGGSIINISSVLGISGAAGYASYQASKHAVIGLTRSVARSHGGDGIRANVICPGFIVTPMSLQNSAEAQEELLGQVPLGRAGDPYEVARLVLFLASEESSYITGAQIPIDGGLLA